MGVETIAEARQEARSRAANKKLLAERRTLIQAYNSLSIDVKHPDT
jgi:hypothetical protein